MVQARLPQHQLSQQRSVFCPFSDHQFLAAFLTQDRSIL